MAENDSRVNKEHTWAVGWVLGFADVAGGGGGVRPVSQRVRELSGATCQVGAAQFAVRVQLPHHGSPRTLHAVGPGNRERERATVVNSVGSHDNGDSSSKCKGIGQQTCAVYVCVWGGTGKIFVIIIVNISKEITFLLLRGILSPPIGR